MDQKNKLSAYLPDKGSKGEKVVVGLSGGMDSFVAAYLLKIQKYDLIAVTVITNWDEFPGDQSQILSCHLTEAKLTGIKDFCHTLGIPHFTVKGSGEFQESVIEEWVGHKITGSFSNPCWDCHDVRMRLLHAKTVQLGVSSLATGHYAKVLHSDGTENTFVHSSNDEVYDQSVLLSRLPQEILRSLTLPLSDLQHKEVVKLGENFGLSGSGKEIRMFHCLPWNESTLAVLKKRVPARYLKGGIIFKDREELADHEGVSQLNYGEPLRVKDGRVSDEYYFAKYSVSSHKAYATSENYFIREKALLIRTTAADEKTLIEPVKGALRFSDGEFADCWVYPKSLDAAYLEWEGPKRILQDEVVSVFKKKGKNSKILISGKLRFLPLARVPEEGEKLVQINYDTEL